MIIGAKATRATDQRGTDYATSDEIHGQYYVVDTVKRLHGHGDQALEWWALYVEKKKEAYSQCIAEVRAQDPEMAKSNKTDAEMLEFYRRMDPCLHRKGY